jgi:uncharacterized membrane protein AbrB (regulator of aidB expression)
MALYVMVFAGSGPIGGLVSGTLAELLGAPAAFSIGAVLAACVLALVAWRVRGVRMPRAEATPTQTLESPPARTRAA